MSKASVQRLFLGIGLACLWGCQVFNPPSPQPSFLDEYLAHPYPLAGSAARTLPDGALEIQAAVQIALENFPSIRAARARTESASAGIDLSNTAYLPRVDLLWQEIRATRNNISGTTLPNPVIPGISGPVGRTTSWESQWGSNAGALLSWEPFDFGFRAAQVDVARSQERQARAELDLTRLDVATQASQAFLGLLAAQEVARAAQANVERREVFARSVHALVNQQLRPGSDASRADAELAQAQIQLVQAEQVVAQGEATMLESLGLEQGRVRLNPGPLLRLPFQPGIPTTDLKGHPLAQSQAAAVESSQARQKALDEAYYPRVLFQGGLYGRGSGFEFTGVPQGGSEGLLPDRGNWFAGVSLYFPAFEIFNIGARRAAEEGAARAERAKFDQLALNLKIQERRLGADLVAAQEISARTPVQLKAAQDSHTQASARYQNGLGTITDVAEAQQLLARAEIDDAIARLSIWRVLAQASKVQGDIAPFLQVVERSPH